MTENTAQLSLSHQLLAHFQSILPGRLLTAQTTELVPELSLYLVDASSMDAPLSHEEAQAVVAEPAYWSFSWASGQVLARWILDHPEVVANRRVLDVGSGSGLVALAASLAGAREVWACDLDAVACLAVQANAALNGLRVQTTSRWMALPKPQCLFAADILYDPENLSLLETFRQGADQVLLADSRVRELNAAGYDVLARGQGLTWPDLGELSEFRQVTLYLAEGAQG